MTGDISLGQHALPSFGPFNGNNAWFIEDVADAHEFQLLGVTQSVQVQVMNHLTGQLITFDQAIGRAFDLAGVTQALDKPTHQGGLTCAQLALKEHNQA